MSHKALIPIEEQVESVWLFINYLLENGFQWGKIDQTLFIKKQKGDILLVQVYVDHIIFGSTNKDLCKAFEKLMKDKFQMSSMGKLTFFLGLQVKQKPDGIFISHDKYVAKILRKFGLTDGKSASTPIDTETPLLKDPDGEDVDVHTYRSMIGSLMYLTSSRPDIMFAVCACARFKLHPKFHTYMQSREFLDISRASHTWACDASEGFDQIIDFLNTSAIQYALTVNPNIYVSCIKQFWSSVSVKKVNDVIRLQALDDRKKVIITEATVQEALRLDDAESIDCLPNEEIFTKLSRMGYEKPSTKLTFYKEFFSAQWKFLIHTILQCMSAKRTSWNEFSPFMALAVIRLSTGRKFIFSKAQVGDLSSHTTKYSSPALTQKVFTNMKRVGKGFFRVETPLFESMIVAQQANDVVDEVVAELPSTFHVISTSPSSPIAEPSSPPQQQQPSPPTHDAAISRDLLHTLLETYTTLTRKVKALEQDKVAQALEIIKLKHKVKKLERKNKLKVSGLRRLRKEEIIANIDTYKGVTLKDVTAVEKTAEIEKDADVQRRPEESQAQIYKIDLEHADKVLSMQDDEDPEETATPSIIIHSEPKSKDKGKGIMVDEPKPLKKQAQIEHDEAYVRELEANLNKNINWDDVTEQVQRKEKEDNVVLRYQALKRKPQTEAQARKNMMIYLRNMAGFKMDYFKGMSYNDIRSIFEKYFNSNMAFLEKTKEQLEEEESRALKRTNESLEEKATKKQKLDEEVEELKEHL
nr:hypothetical protein [Tanacetum cinerariifolium]